MLTLRLNLFNKMAVSNDDSLNRGHVRGMLGNKCAGHHNLKTVHFRETLASGNCLAWTSASRVFLQPSIYPRTVAASFHVTV
jgi:hypothetical protein